MRFKIKQLSAAIISASLVSSCAVTPYSEEEKYEPLQTKPTPLVVERSATYMREVTPEEAIFNRKVSFTGKVALIDAIRKQLTGINIVPGDKNVKLDQEIRVFAQDMLLADYLQYLESVTGYDIEYKNNVITVRSFIQKEWNVATFASKRSIELKVGSTFNLNNVTSKGETTTKSGSESGNKIEGKIEVDEWDIIVQSAKDILNVKGKNAKSDEGDMQPYVQAVRSVGTLNVGGPVHRVNALDSFVSNLIVNGQRQVNINVQAYDVSLNDDRGAGIDWTQLATVDGSLNGNPLDIALNGIKRDGASTNLINQDNGLFESAVSYSSDSIKADAVVRFLSQFGEVELLNQPNITVRNGSYAYISTGEEFTFVGEIEVEEEDNGDEKTTAKLDSVRVGVTLAVAPRILGDGRIMLDIWPVISSVSGLKVYPLAGDLKYEIPDVALNELSTEVITESGKPIQLGGFIRRAIESNLQDLPWKDRVTQKTVNPLFRSENNKLDRRELVLTVTPTIVEGV